MLLVIQLAPIYPRRRIAGYIIFRSCHNIMINTQISLKRTGIIRVLSLGPLPVRTVTMMMRPRLDDGDTHTKPLGQEPFYSGVGDDSGVWTAQPVGRFDY